MPFSFILLRPVSCHSIYFFYWGLSTQAWIVCDAMSVTEKVEPGQNCIWWVADSWASCNVLQTSCNVLWTCILWTVAHIHGLTYIHLLVRTTYTYWWIVMVWARPLLLLGAIYLNLWFEMYSRYHLVSIGSRCHCVWPLIGIQVSTAFYFLCPIKNVILIF